MSQFRKSKERKAITSDGGFMLLVGLVLVAASGLASILLAAPPIAAGAWVLLTILGWTATVLVLTGFYSLQPNEGAVITLFSNYKGSDRTPGLRWVLPWYARRKISVRARNVISQTLKVNDKGGSPIEIAAVVVWRVADTAQALFDVENYSQFVDIQIETALREIASHFYYDSQEEGEPNLRSNGDEVSAMLKHRLEERVSLAGVEIEEARLSHLAYASEIAGAMLRRQQAEAVLAARAKIVRGAVDMVETALAELTARGVAPLDEERRAAMVSNLLVVLCADREAQPVINAGTLYG
ncbi:MAG: SPFH domain-containing protein [Hyphomonadaceae bacterium]|nr:SPFH domain-containing protein [Hyphomonadaceae bacterium]